MPFVVAAPIIHGTAVTMYALPESTRLGLETALISRGGGIVVPDLWPTPAEI